MKLKSILLASITALSVSSYALAAEEDKTDKDEKWDVMNPPGPKKNY